MQNRKEKIAVYCFSGKRPISKAEIIEVLKYLISEKCRFDLYMEDGKYLHEFSSLRRLIENSKDKKYKNIIIYKSVNWSIEIRDLLLKIINFLSKKTNLKIFISYKLNLNI